MMNDYKELISTLRTHAEYCDMPFSWMNDAYSDAADAIEQLVKERDDEPVRHGHWVAKKVMARTPFAINHYCSKCKFETDFCTNYCSNCGAKMDEVSE